MIQSRHVLALTLLAGLAASASAANNAAAPGFAALERNYPGLQSHTRDGRITHVFGVQMTAAETPEAAAQLWISQYAPVLGGGTELINDWTTTTGDGKHTVVSYRQKLQGFNVENANVRVVVLNAPRAGGQPRVIMVTSSMVGEMSPEQLAVNVDAVDALAIVRAMPLYRNIPKWSEPTLVIWPGENASTPILAWSFSGSSPRPEDAVDFGFFVNAGTGKLEHVRNQIHTQGPAIAGQARGLITPGVLPDIATNPPALANLPEIRASLSGSGGSVFTDRNGFFSIAPVGAGPFTLTVAPGPLGVGGRWVEVLPAAGTPQMLATVPNVTAPFNGVVQLNTAPSELQTAQINTFYWTTLTHNFMRDRAPGFTAISLPIRANTGVTGTCNAFFSPSEQSINFYNVGGGCNNTAYSTVVAHEYGHFIVNRLNLSQGNFGEGFGDSVSILLLDDNIIGRSFRTDGTSIRNPVGANVQAPCNTGASVHFCGQILGASWARIKDNFKTTYGSTAGLARAQQLFVSWAVTTAGWPGGSANNNLTPMATEIIVLNDDDGNLLNGTPDRAAICGVMGQASIRCPSTLTIAFPNGRPSEVAPNTPTLVTMTVQNLFGTQSPSTAQLFWRAGGSAFTSAPVVQTGTGTYAVTLPGAPCGSRIEWYVRIADLNGEASTLPATAPAAFFATVATLGSLGSPTTAANLDFNTDPVWTVTNSSGLTSGAWVRAVPATPNAGNIFMPPTAAGGSGFAWVTDNQVGAGDGTFDIDGGSTTLTTGVYNAAGVGRMTMTVSRWFQTNLNDDRLETQVSSDNGATWVTMERLNASLTGWQSASFNADLFVPLTSQMRFRFIAADEGTGSLVEAGIDSFSIQTQSCVTNACYANCDGSTAAPVLGASDFSCFLNRFRAGDSYANCDGSTAAPVLGASDFSCFLGRFRAGCS